MFKPWIPQKKWFDLKLGDRAGYSITLRLIHRPEKHRFKKWGGAPFCKNVILGYCKVYPKQITFSVKVSSKIMEQGCDYLIFLTGRSTFLDNEYAIVWAFSLYHYWSIYCIYSIFSNFVWHHMDAIYVSSKYDRI